MGPSGKVYHSRFSAIGHGTRLWYCTLRAVGEVWIWLQPTYFLVKSCCWMSWRSLLELEFGTKEGSAGKEVRMDGLQDLKEMWEGVRESCKWCSVAALGMRWEDWGQERERDPTCNLYGLLVCGNRKREEKVCISLYALLAGMACDIAFISQIHPIQVS